MVDRLSDGSVIDVNEQVISASAIHHPILLLTQHHVPEPPISTRDSRTSRLWHGVIRVWRDKRTRTQSHALVWFFDTRWIRVGGKRHSQKRSYCSDVALSSGDVMEFSVGFHLMIKFVFDCFEKRIKLKCDC